MSSSCPYCNENIELPENEFYINCEACGKGLSLDGLGNVVIEEESEVIKEIATEEEAPAVKETTTEEETPAVKETTTEEETPAVKETATDEVIVEASVPIETSTDVSLDANLDTNPESHLEEVKESIGEEQAALKSFAKDSLSLDFNESCLYDLMISGIDSTSTQLSLISIFEDARLYLDMEVIRANFKDNISGKVSLKALNVLKLSCIVQAIYNNSISVDLYWDQKNI